MIENTYGISMIKIQRNAVCFCPLGNDWYTNHLQIDFIPSEYIPDYCELDQWIEMNIAGQKLIVEDAVSKLYDYFKTKYLPKSISVTSMVDDANHCKVTVCK